MLDGHLNAGLVERALRELNILPGYNHQQFLSEVHSFSSNDVIDETIRSLM